MANQHPLREKLHVAEASQPACLNCGASLTGPFCPECGQRDIPAYPSVRELFLDAVSEFSGWDGRVATTIEALLRRPGLLTHEFLEGRRVRYVSPLRLYLTASLVYFVLAASAPDVRLGSGKGVGLQIGTTKTADTHVVSRPERVGKAARESFEQQTLTQAEKEAALKDIERAPAVMQPFLRRAISDPGGFKRGLLEMMPRMLFALLPIFAGIVALFYRGRKYPEHLYFAIHLHAFIFLALAASELLKFTKVPALVAIASAIGVCWIPIYATLAFRRVYGGSLAQTLVKEVAIGALYSITAAAGFIILIYWVSIAT